MLGVIRFLLSFSVIAFHLTSSIPNIGLLAVNFFYVISGFLITLVLHETYGFRFAPFATNRFLRLYPAYFAVAGISLILSITSENYALFHASWSASASVADIFGNIAIFPWAFLSDDVAPVGFLPIDALHSSVPHFRLVPSTWSVGVEIACYFLLWLVTARWVWTAVASIVVAITWHWYVANVGGNPLMAYFPVPAALLPFGLGALAYHITKVVPIRSFHGAQAVYVTTSICVLFLINWYFSLSSPNFLRSVTYYANDLLAFIAVVTINRTRHRGNFGLIDKWLGDLAYPMFLGQFVFGYVAWRIIGIDAPTRSYPVFIIGTLLSVGASILIVHFVDRGLMRVRDRVRNRADTKALHTGLNAKS